MPNKPTGPYKTLDWQNIGSPMTPFISMQFRGSTYIHTFPNPTNRIYVGNANFEVLSDAGSSTASITLVDPDFVNLEAFFAKAQVIANRTSKTNGYWFCRVFWGWTYYGRQVDFYDGGKGQSKHSGIHAYLLKDLRYDLDEVELKVTFELIDLGEGLFNGRHNEPDPSIGNLNLRDTPPANQSQGGLKTITKQDVLDETLKNLFSQKSGDPFYDDIKAGTAVGTTLGEKGFYVEDASSNESTTTEQDVEIENVFYNRTPWHMLRTVLRKWWAKNNNNEDLKVTWDETIEGTKIGGPINQETKDKYVIGAKEGIRSVVEKLLSMLELDGYSAVMIAGVRLEGSDGIYPKEPGIVFGWQPVPPTKPMDDKEAQDKFRLARTFVYRPGNKEEIAKGQTMINNLSYEWSSKGYYMFGLPQIYAITITNDGKLKIISTEADFENATDDEKQNIYYMSTGNATNEAKKAQENLEGADPSVKGENTKVNKLSAKHYDLNTALDALPTESAGNYVENVDGISGGYEVEFNYDSRGGNEVDVENDGRRLVINVWNKFAKEIFDVSISIPGDPWLDNSIWNVHGQNNFRNQDYLVNLYNSYFKITIHRPLPNNQNAISNIITGNYLCIKGCSHNISDGEYTTSLKLIKAW